MMAGSKDLQPLTERFFPTIFVRNQFRTHAHFPAANTDLSGMVAIVTGANTGLGLEAARQLLSLHLSTLIIAVRSVEKGESAAKKLRRNHGSARIQVWALDMLDYRSIQAFAARAEGLPRLDIVILNAGLANMSFNAVPATNHDEVFQVNYLSTVLLAILMLRPLKEKSPSGQPGRLTLVNGAVSLTAKFSNRSERPLLKSFDNPKTFDARDSYHTSKMLCHMFLWKLVEYVSADDVIVNLADPGYIKGTQLARSAPMLLVPLVKGFEAATGRSIEMGASTYLDAIITKGKESHGCFLMSYQIEPFHAMLYTTDGEIVIEQVWKETMQELEFAKVGQILEAIKP